MPGCSQNIDTNGSFLFWHSKSSEKKKKKHGDHGGAPDGLFSITVWISHFSGQ